MTSGMPALRTGPASHDLHMTSVQLSFQILRFAPPHDLWPWVSLTLTPYNQRGVEGYTWCKFGQDRCWGFRDMVVTLKWPMVTSVELSCKLVELSCKFQDFTPKWPWTLDDLDPDPLITIGGSRAISGAILVKIGAGVLEWSRNIHTYIRRHIPWIIVKMQKTVCLHVLHISWSAAPYQNNST